MLLEFHLFHSLWTTSTIKSGKGTLSLIKLASELEKE